MRFSSVEQDRREYNFNVAPTADSFTGNPGTYRILLATMAAANRACSIPFPQRDYLSSDPNNTITSWASFDPRCLFDAFLGTEDPGASDDTRAVANRDVKKSPRPLMPWANLDGMIGSSP